MLLSTGMLFGSTGGGGGGGGGPATSYFNTGGRGNRTASITTTLVSGAIIAGTIDNLVDGGVGTNVTDSVVFSSGQTATIIKFDFGTAKIIDGFRWFQNQNAAHGTYVFEGSNDDSSYTQIGSSFTLGASTLTNFVGTNSTAYRYYRLRQTAGTTSSTPWLEEIEFRIAATGDAARDAMEYGDRTSLITVSTTLSVTAGTINNLIDGALSTSSNDYVIFGGGQSTKEIKFDLGVTKVLTGFHWVEDDGSSNGTWVIEGSNDDSSYTGLGSSFTLGGGPVLEVTWSNSTAYRYYKLRQTAGSTGTLINFEIEFRIT